MDKTLRDLLQSLDPFTRQYLLTALWASSDPDTGENLEDFDLEDIDEDTLAEAWTDAADFQAAHGERIAHDPERAGQDFFLTRNRHGAGFWDGDWEHGDDLTEASHGYGTFELYPHEGKIYHHG